MAKLKKLKINDKNAWTDFYRTNVNSVYRYALARCENNVTLAEDITQQTFLTAVDRIQSFSGNSDKLLYWLIGIARIEVLRHFGRKDRVMGDALDLDKISPDNMITDDIVEPEVYSEIADNMLINRIFTEMPEMHGRVLRMKYCDELSVREISEQTGRSFKSVESLLARARDGFKKLYTQIRSEMEWR